MTNARAVGSSEEFDRDWEQALSTRDPCWFVYPDERARDQTSLGEWVKAQQVLEILAAYGLDRGSVLEYGCGAAGTSIFLRERGYRTVAIDLSMRALEVARLNDERHRTQPGPLPVLVADSLSLPFAEGSFDAVMSYGLLDHFEASPLAGLLDEVIRVLRPGGVFVADIIPARPNARGLGNALSCAALMLYDATPSASVMRRLRPLWRRFDRADSRITRAWGWMYLVSAVRPRLP